MMKTFTADRYTYIHNGFSFLVLKNHQHTGIVFYTEHRAAAYCQSNNQIHWAPRGCREIQGLIRLY